MTRGWITNNIHSFVKHVITDPRLNFHGSLTKPLVKSTTLDPISTGKFCRFIASWLFKLFYFQIAFQFHSMFFYFHIP